MENAEKRIVVHNPTAMLLYVGSEVIPPGETRDFAESQVPPHLRPAADVAEAVPAVDPLGDAIALLLDQSVSSVSAIIGERTETGEPKIGDEQLTQIEQAESAGKSRKGVLSAIAEERIKRANERAEIDALAKQAKTNRDAFIDLIQVMDDEELAAQIDIVQDDAALVALVEEEQKRRAG